MNLNLFIENVNYFSTKLDFDPRLESAGFFPAKTKVYVDYYCVYIDFLSLKSS